MNARKVIELTLKIKNFFHDENHDFKIKISKFYVNRTKIFIVYGIK